MKVELDITRKQLGSIPYTLEMQRQGHIHQDISKESAFENLLLNILAQTEHPKRKRTPGKCRPVRLCGSTRLPGRLFVDLCSACVAPCER